LIVLLTVKSLTLLSLTPSLAKATCSDCWKQALFAVQSLF